MPDYCFFQKGQKVIVLERSAADKASQLTTEGYERQFEEVYATNEENALSRFVDIRRNNKIDRNNFLAGAGTMPLIGFLATALASLFRKK
jgi:hypothetical protein